MFLGFTRTANSLSFGANIDSAVGVSFNANDATGYVITMSPDASVNPSISVDAGATGDITLGLITGVGTGSGSMALTGNLSIDHNGTGLLNFNRAITGTGFGITKTGTGTMMLNSIGTSPNTFTGDVNINQGRLIANGFVPNTDINNAANVNLGGGILEVRNISGSNKDYNAVDLNVTSASTLAYQNTGATNFSLTFSGANAFDLDADLTVQNSSPTTTLQNVINISRNITGAGNLIVDSYNNINSSTTSFSLGRIALGGTNTSWTGGLDIRKGTAEIYGTAANMDDYTGSISIGETGNSFGAGLLLTPSANANITFTNAITVRTGGFRTIRSGVGPFVAGGDTFYTFSGPLTLDGNLNLHVDANNSDRRMVITGNISGAGGLDLTRGNNGFFRISGNNAGWSGNLTINQGTLEVRGNAVNSAGTGQITIGATGSTTATALNFVPESSSGTVSYTNNITVNSGGSRTLGGGGTNHNLTLTGNMTLNGDLIVNHNWSTSDRRVNLNGSITGNGGITVTRTAGSTETTLRLAGTNTYLGGTTVSNTASLALASTASLASNVLVQAGGRIGGPGTINANLNLEDTANFFFYAVGLNESTYVPMTVTGTVTLSNNFSVANIIGGSRGEVVDWANTPDGTYTLIASTPSSLSNIQNFGSANYATIAVSPTRYAYFQGTTGLQIVVSSTPPTSNPFTTWSSGANFNDDANNDGVSNGVAWFLGAADVNEKASGYFQLDAVTAGALVVEFDCLTGANRGDAIFAVQYGGNLATLDSGGQTEVPGTIGTFTAGTVDFEVTAGPGGLLHVVATIPVSEAVAGKLFGRIIGQE
jgi:fibronectin-binding autotransporter adhesin